MSYPGIHPQLLNRVSSLCSLFNREIPGATTRCLFGGAPEETLSPQRLLLLPHRTPPGCYTLHGTKLRVKPKQGEVGWPFPLKTAQFGTLDSIPEYSHLNQYIYILLYAYKYTYQLRYPSTTCVCISIYIPSCDTNRHTNTHPLSFNKYSLRIPIYTGLLGKHRVVLIEIQSFPCCSKSCKEIPGATVKRLMGCSLGDSFTAWLHLPLQRAPRRRRYLKHTAMVTNLNADAIADLLQAIPVVLTLAARPRRAFICLYPMAQLLPLEPGITQCVAPQGPPRIHSEPSYFYPLTLKFTRIFPLVFCLPLQVILANSSLARGTAQLNKRQQC